MTYFEFINQLISFLIEYFSIKQNRIFWLLVLFFTVIVENGTKTWKKRNYMKLWLKTHNIGKKYKYHKKTYKEKLPQTPYEKQQAYIESIWEEMKK